jgi:hypothetical protein
MPTICASKLMLVLGDKALKRNGILEVLLLFKENDYERW